MIASHDSTRRERFLASSISFKPSSQPPDTPPPQGGVLLLFYQPIFPLALGRDHLREATKMVNLASIAILMFHKNWLR